MELPSGRRLTALGAALIALAASAAAVVAVTEGFPGAGTGAAAPAAPEATAMSAGDHVALAVSAESRGDVAGALSHYRAAVSRDPRCVDRRSPGFLGDAFEEKLKSWLAGLRSGRIAGGAAARSDASFIFRRMYGGCG